MQVNNLSEIQKYYTALLERDPGFVGIFYVGVKTTGVFCISTCRARKPKPENVEFFRDLKDALRFGYRPCKICRPAENAFEMPEMVSKALLIIKENPFQKVSDYQLVKIGIQPEKVRRWFKQNYGITFQAYQRMIRINSAFKEIQNGENVTSSAYGSGYNSLSGFGYTFKKLTGHAPEKSKEKDLILMSRFNTPLGPMYACSTNQGICLLEFTDRRMLETEFHDLQRRLNAKIVAGENEHIVQLKQELQEYFEGKRQTFDVKLYTPGSVFQQAVWDLLLQVPYGTTVSYMEQALKLNAPKAVRAVASANGHNRVCIVIPCHRVIGSDGNLTGYAGGLERKRWLLEHEKGNRREVDK
jgi:AraC family transcriptional regulator of adaptative response/methylated-DNA-[protein]-cysteine methyltransferase